MQVRFLSYDGLLRLPFFSVVFTMLLLPENQFEFELDKTCPDPNLPLAGGSINVFFGGLSGDASADNSSAVISQIL
ncbi:hypothetical protein PBY51_007182 [Eleginops maclovinus]|uniref:Uncharacterized protein n=1 Tax=Eleginops maclovinus TaxID=56733 RepID=A0AAN8AEW4_ELEMC|nr:hypothetical protein PBY51_007182 [Eleginops maclovinus]